MTYSPLVRIRFGSEFVIDESTNTRRYDDSLTSVGYWISALPRLKNNKAIGVADVNTPEEHGW
jgi:hypothetical protein